jgi:hypothetical protein
MGCVKNVVLRFLGERHGAEMQELVRLSVSRSGVGASYFLGRGVLD